MPQLDQYIEALDAGLLQALEGFNEKIDISDHRHIIDHIGITQIIDPEILFDADPSGNLEHIIKAFKRPSLLVKENSFDPSPSETWNEILTANLPVLSESLKAVGRIELKNHDSMDWAGTGFLLENDIVVTNRHVAKYFVDVTEPPHANLKNDDNKVVRGRIDFREEHLQPEEEEFLLTDVLFVGGQDGPDLALFRCPGAGTKIPSLQISEVVNPDTIVTAVGYPWKDSRGLASVESVMKRIFGEIFGVKRLAPGKILGVSDGILKHDCTTLGGSSGSGIIDVETGRVAGVHFHGSRRFNSAVSAGVLRDIVSNT